MIKSKTFEWLSPTNRNVRREKNGRILVELTAKRCDKANEVRIWINPFSKLDGTSLQARGSSGEIRDFLF